MLLTKFWDYLLKNFKLHPKRTTKQITGERAEKIAEEYLIANGLKIIGRNIKTQNHNQKGEIDLLCKDGPLIVFVEVRYRKINSWISAGKSINPKKKRILVRTAKLLMKKMGIIQARIDAILIDEGKEIVWVKNLI